MDQGQCESWFPAQEFLRSGEFKILEGLMIGAQKDMLTVIDNIACPFIPVGITSAAEPGRLFDECDAEIVLGKSDRGGQSTEATADDHDIYMFLHECGRATGTLILTGRRAVVSRDILSR